MPPDNVSVDEKFTKMLLNLYSEITNLPAAIYLEGNEEKPIYSDIHWPMFCQKMCNVVIKDFQIYYIVGFIIKVKI